VLIVIGENNYHNLSIFIYLATQFYVENLGQHYSRDHENVENEEEQ
jgi:hypothetical protein